MTKHDALRILLIEAESQLQLEKAPMCFCHEDYYRDFGDLCWNHKVEAAIRQLGNEDFSWTPSRMSKELEEKEEVKT